MTLAIDTKLVVNTCSAKVDEVDTVFSCSFHTYIIGGMIPIIKGICVVTQFKL